LRFQIALQEHHLFQNFSIIEILNYLRSQAFLQWKNLALQKQLFLNVLISWKPQRIFCLWYLINLILKINYLLLNYRIIKILDLIVYSILRNTIEIIFRCVIFYLLFFWNLFCALIIHIQRHGIFYGGIGIKNIFVLELGLRQNLICLDYLFRKLVPTRQILLKLCWSE